MGSVWEQAKLVLWKNFLISQRTKQYLRENISVVILGVFLVLIEKTDHNNFMSPFYLSMALIGYTRTTGLNWVQEREARQKELQKIMGMTSAGYLVGWLLYFLLNALIVCTLMMAVFYFGVLIPNPHFIFAEGYGYFNVVLLYWLYACSLIGFVLMVSNFFDKAKAAAQGIVFIQLILNFFYFFRFSGPFSQSAGLIRLSGLVPQLAFNFGIGTIAFNNGQSYSMNYTYEAAAFTLAATAIGYTLIAFYLDQVLPNELGIKKHPLFFLKCFGRSEQNYRSQEVPLLGGGGENETSARYEQQRLGNDQPLIKLEGVTRAFGSKEAVSDLTIKFYPNEIFCLLGHNGAGKSTAINLLTGILPVTKGQIELMGLNYRNDLDQIRQNIGLCLQYNVLYDELTVEDHLKFYAVIKGVPKEHLAVEIENIINECALANEKGKLSKNLSGGNKRKLSLANALIGKSKIVFLDEPSSGLDPNSRRGIWDILKNIRSENRCVILTTHHLEEAEELSQKIGIMSNGKLVIIGDCNFIQDKFSVGYHVVLSFKAGESKKMEECRRIVLREIEGVKQDEQTALNTLKFVLPVGQSSKFSHLFSQIETLASVSVKVSNLEDAFIKLGEEEDTEQSSSSAEPPELNLPDIACSYRFSSQFKAVFYRKATTTFRSLGTVVSVVLPIVFILMGVLLVCLVIEGDSEQERFIKRYLMGYFFVWAFVFNTSIYCGDLVLEREKKFRYLSNVMGLRKLPYWSANYCFDLLIFTIPLAVFFIVVFAIGKQAHFLTEVTKYLVPLFVLFALSFIGYSYLFSFMFQKSSTAFRLFPFFNLIFFFVVPSFAIQIAKDGVVAQKINPLLSPFMAFFNSFFTKEILGDYIRNQFMSWSLTYNYCCLVVQIFFFAAATLFVDNLRMRLKDRQQITAEDQQQDMAEDNVMRHEQRNSLLTGERQSQSSNERNDIVIQHLYKKYSNGFKAIRDNSFEVRRGEIFGLLGPNGAGKSTTFNIITAAISKTSGVVQLLGENVDNSSMSLFSNVGVCPQYDSLYETLTTEEHLYYFARLKGIKESEIEGALKYYVELLSLTPYTKIRSQFLSGGNKRKLTVSMAMLANPQVMFFDEPSAGVDPISRRFLWKSLSLSTRTKGASMVLTTHTMSEAESLCSRIGILIKGKFVTVASPAELKARYGKGYRATVKAAPENKEEIRRIVGQQFPGEVEMQEQQNNILFTIQSSRFLYSKAYALFESLLKGGLINRYQINQSTLEEVFLYLSQLQPEADTEMKIKQPWEFCCWECGANGCQCLM